MKRISTVLYYTVFLSIFVAQNRAVDKEQLNNKIYGCVLGAALGDMLGAPVEFISSRAAINRIYPLSGITGTESLKENDFRLDAQGNRVAPYTDDTAMSILVLEALLKSYNSENINTVMISIAQAFVNDLANPYGWVQPERAPGIASQRSVRRLESLFKLPESSCQIRHSDNFWQAGGIQDGGCGSVMHAYPFGLFYMHDAQKAVTWAAEHSKITHGAPIAIAACAAMAAGIVAALHDETPDYTVDKMIAAARLYDNTTAEMIERARSYVGLKIRHDVLLDRVFTEFKGWAAHEAIAAAVFVFLSYPDNFISAILLGVNTPGDSDSIATLAGALVGARVGAKQIPEDWLSVLEGKEKLTQLAQGVISAVNP